MAFSEAAFVCSIVVGFCNDVTCNIDIEVAELLEDLEMLVEVSRLAAGRLAADRLVADRPATGKLTTGKLVGVATTAEAGKRPVTVLGLPTRREPPTQIIWVYATWKASVTLKVEAPTVFISVLKPADVRTTVWQRLQYCVTTAVGAGAADFISVYVVSQGSVTTTPTILVIVMYPVDLWVTAVQSAHCVVGTSVEESAVGLEYGLLEDEVAGCSGVCTVEWELSEVLVSVDATDFVDEAVAEGTVSVADSVEEVVAETLVSVGVIDSVDEAVVEGLVSVGVVDFVDEAVVELVVSAGVVELVNIGCLLDRLLERSTS